MDYLFEIQKYPFTYWDEERKTYVTEPKGQIINIEETFKCKYVRLEGANHGEIKNIYTESYAESEELRVHIPKELAYKNTDVSLTLLFPVTENTDVLRNERAFFEYVSGRKIEYFDTFRNLYFTLILTKKPETVNEILYGDNKYRQVKYTFTNIYGRGFTTSKIAELEL